MVRKGDSLYLIARRYHVTSAELQDLNGIADPRSLQIGRLLRIPKILGKTPEIYGGPYVSAESAKKERSQVTLPDLRSIGVVMSMPLRDNKLGSSFGYRGSRFHEGIDLLASEGTPVYAAHDGTVVFSGQRLSGYGNMVAIKSGQIMTVYAHNSENFVERGDTVQRGDEIAAVGSTGRASGPHLHFEVRVRGDNDRYYAVEPFEFLPRR